MHQTQALVVDDHEIVRRCICSILSADSEFDIICETSTGEDALAKAKEHLPDVVLLDIGLPGISGLAAARSIRAVSPLSRILFVSQHNLQEMVQEAFRAGENWISVEVGGGTRAAQCNTRRIGRQAVSE